MRQTKICAFALAFVAAFTVTAATAQETVMLRYEDMRELTDRLDSIQRDLENLESSLRILREKQAEFRRDSHWNDVGFTPLTPPGDDSYALPHYRGFFCWNERGYRLDGVDRPDMVCAWKIFHPENPR